MIVQFSSVQRTRQKLRQVRWRRVTDSGFRPAWLENLYREPRRRGARPEPGSPVDIEDITAAATQWVFDECPGALAKTVADVRSVVYQRWAEWCGKRGYQLTAENRFAGELYSLNLPDGQRITAGRTFKPLADGRRPYVFSGLRLRVGAGALRVVAGS